MEVLVLTVLAILMVLAQLAFRADGSNGSYTPAYPKQHFQAVLPSPSPMRNWSGTSSCHGPRPGFPRPTSDPQGLCTIPSVTAKRRASTTVMWKWVGDPTCKSEIIELVGIVEAAAGFLFS
jgi:hypothetical protein